MLRTGGLQIFAVLTVHSSQKIAKWQLHCNNFMTIHVIRMSYCAFVGGFSYGLILSKVELLFKGQNKRTNSI